MPRFVRAKTCFFKNNSLYLTWPQQRLFLIACYKFLYIYRLRILFLSRCWMFLFRLFTELSYRIFLWLYIRSLCTFWTTYQKYTDFFLFHLEGHIKWKVMTSLEMRLEKVIVVVMKIIWGHIFGHGEVKWPLISLKHGKVEFWRYKFSFDMSLDMK